jgi:phage-related minor tail protein
MSLDLGELVGSLRMDVLPWDQALSKADASLVTFAADTKSTGKKAGDEATSGLASGLAGMDSEARAAGSSAASSLGAALADAETEAKGAGADAGKGFSDEFKQGAATAGKAAGAGAAGALAAGFVDNINVEAGLNKVGVQLGLGKEGIRIAGEVAGDVYANNFGDELPQVNEALANVVRNMNIGVRDVNLQPIVEKVLTVADAFDQDLGMTTAAVGQMIRTGMVKDAEEGLDVLTAGLQTPADKAGDLAETMNEYGTQFRKLGLDGKDAMGLLSQGLQGGARDADIVADALKEMSLKTQEATTKTTKLAGGETAINLSALGEAFEAIGVEVLDADGNISKIGETFQKDLAGGGPKAKAALDKVLDGIQKIEDPSKRTATMVALFGTQAEDMGDALLNLDLDKAGEEIGKVEGAAQKAVDQMGSGSQAKIEGWGRKLQGIGRDAIEALGPLGTLGGAIAGVLPMVASVVGPVVGSWLAMSGASLAGAASMASAWLIAIWPIALVIAAVVGLAIIIYKNWDTIKEKTAAAWDWVVQKTTGAWDSLVGAVKEKGGAAVDWVKAMPGKVVDAVGDAGNTLKQKGKDLMQGAKDGITTKWEDVKSWVSSIPDKATNAISGAASALKQKGKDLIAGARDGITEKWEDARTWLSSVPEKATNAVGGVLTTLKEKGKDLISGAKDGITEKWEDAKTWLGDIGTKAKTAVGDLTGLLKQAGIDIVAGLIAGIVEKFEDLKDKVGDITGWIKKNKGPKAYDLTLWRGPGNWIMQGLITGLDDEMPALQSKVGDVTDSIANAPMPSLMAAATPNIPESNEVRAYATTQGGPAGGVVNHWNITESTSPQATAAEVARRQALAGVGA